MFQLHLFHFFFLFPFLILGCSGSSLTPIDEKVELMLKKEQEKLGGEFFQNLDFNYESGGVKNQTTTKIPTTNNPRLQDLPLNYNYSEETSESIVVRLNSFNITPENTMSMSIKDAVGWSVVNSREYKTAQETYILACLSLISEQHLWGPLFSSTITSNLGADGSGGFYESSISVVNDLNVTKKLSNGGEVGVQALATWAKALNDSVSTNKQENVDFVLSAAIPLLKGSGAVARESLVQAQRNLIYASRAFERFRRNFLLELSDDFLNLVVSNQRIENASRRVDSLRQLASRQFALYEAGRKNLYDAQLAENNVLTAVSQLNTTSEGYRLALDRFKTRIGWPIEVALEILPTSLDLTPPETSLEEAVNAAFTYRLDLQTSKDEVEDAKRAVVNAKNNLLPDLDLSSSISIPSHRETLPGGAQFNSGDTNYAIGLTLDVPIDPLTKEITVRKKLIASEQKKRTHLALKDSIAISVRAAVRNIDSALLTLDLQKKGVKIAQLGQQSIEARQDSATVLEQLESINNLLSAENDVSDAKKNLQSSILRYLLETGQLRLDNKNLVKSIDKNNPTNKENEVAP